MKPDELAACEKHFVEFFNAQGYRCDASIFEQEIAKEMFAAGLAHARKEQADSWNHVERRNYEHFAIDVLGKERFDASPCQAHPLQLVAEFVKEQAGQIEALRKDAERYRMLRDFDSGKTELAICRWSEHGWVGEWVIEHEPDAAIDAAIKEVGK